MLSKTLLAVPGIFWPAIYVAAVHEHAVCTDYFAHSVHAHVYMCVHIQPFHFST